MFRASRGEANIIEDGGYFYWKNSTSNLRTGRTQWGFNLTLIQLYAFVDHLKYYFSFFSFYVERRYIKCKFSRDPLAPCRVRGKYVNDRVILNPGTRHECDPSDALVHFKAFRDALHGEIQRNSRSTACQIYESVAQR